MEMIWAPERQRRASFTLMELLVVMAIIAILLVAIVPAVNSLSKSSGRKAAVNNLLGAIEQARVQAIKDGQATYIAFPDQLPSADAATVQRYSYRSYAVFEDDEANPGSVKQLTPWRSLPTGVSLRSGSLGYLAKTISFPFSPLGAGKTASFPALKFTSNGEVDPSSTPAATTGTVQFGVFEGFVDPGGGDKDTNATKPTETIAVNRLTGRAQRM
jgi:prepilin-type N-terminal cleavage/methylation domain-containing protein